MKRQLARLIAGLALLAAALPGPALADPPSFGDDSGRFAKDGECDDMRFDGPGMAGTALVDSEILRDATDCRAAFGQNRVRYLGGQRSGPLIGASQPGPRCDDKRVTEPDMPATAAVEQPL